MRFDDSHVKHIVFYPFYSFNTYLLSVYMSEIILSNGGKAVNKTDKNT